MEWMRKHGESCEKCGSQVGCCHRTQEETHKTWAAALSILQRVAVPGSNVSLSDPDELLFGNLPFPCPRCSRMRLNYYPKDNSIACEKCDTRWPEARDDDERSGGPDPYADIRAIPSGQKRDHERRTEDPSGETGQGRTRCRPCVRSLLGLGIPRKAASPRCLSALRRTRTRGAGLLTMIVPKQE